MAMRRPLIAAFAITACLMFAWATGAGRPYPASAGGVIDPTCTSSSPCIEYDNSGSGPGIRGISVVGNGLSGSTKNKSTFNNARAGVMGNDVGTGSFNSGVHGLSVNGTGVSGQSTNAVGVFGTGLAVGVSGDAPFGVGVRGDTRDGIGMRGDATDGAGVLGSSTTGVGVEAVGGGMLSSHHYPALSVVGNTSSDLIDGCPSGTANPCSRESAGFSVDNSGNATVNNLIVVHQTDAAEGIIAFDNIDVESPAEFTQNAVCVAGCPASATSVRRVRTYSPQSSQPMIEDNGEAQLVNGSAYVRVDPAFANVVDQRTIYSVSITPEGNSNGLYVNQKTLNGFAVRENNGGRSSVAFEYRIVAKPFGSTAKRLPMVEIPLRRTIGARTWHPGR